MLYRSLDRIMLRRTRAEVASHLPQKEYVGTHLFPGGPVAIWLRMDGKQEKAYRQMQVQSVADVEGGQLSAIGTLAEWTRLKQFANSYGRMDTEGNFHPALPSNKLDFLIQRLIELGYPDDPDTKVVVVSQFTQVLHLFKAAVEKEFGTGIAAMVTGGITGDQRSSMIDSFNQPIGSKSQYNPLVMFLNTKAGGSAITLDVADEMIFLDQTWIPDDQEQAEGRIDNRRPEEKIVQRRYLYLATEDSIDQYVAEVNHERGEAGRQILDGRRGVEYLRAVSERMR
jgi:SNF2 family DNA or RNA helicase